MPEFPSSEISPAFEIIPASKASPTCSVHAKLGIKPTALSTVTGHTRRNAAILQRSTVIHFGAFFNGSLKSSTASTITPADTLIPTTFKKSSLISRPPL